MQKRVLAGVVLLAVLLALIFAFYPGNSQVIDLSTGAGISKMLRYENAQVYLFGETHRCTEYQQFRNALFQYLVKEKGVRVLVEESGYATAFLENETVQGRLSFSDWLDRCTLSKEDYELYSWIADWNSGRDAAEKISIIGIDITDDVGNIQTLCQYLLKNHDFTGADTQTQWLLTAIRNRTRSVLCNSRPFRRSFCHSWLNCIRQNRNSLKPCWGHKRFIWNVLFWAGKKHRNNSASKGKRSNWVAPMVRTGKVAYMSISCGSISRNRTQNIMGSLAERTF